jgi:polysaccharide export outer membrane protein
MEGSSGAEIYLRLWPMLVGGGMRVLLALLLLCSLGTAAGAQALQPGDSISISVYQDPKLDRQVVIGPTGMISFPLAGQIRAGGLTPAALESVLRYRLKDKFTEEPDVTVTLLAVKPLEEDLKPRIFVTGEVLRPGFFIARTRTNVMQAISLAGGFGPYAAKRRIQVRRQINGIEVMFLFNYVDFHSGRNVEDNIDLQNGDVVIVPERGIFDFQER